MDETDIIFTSLIVLGLIFGLYIFLGFIFHMNPKIINVKCEKNSDCMITGMLDGENSCCDEKCYDESSGSLTIVCVNNSLAKKCSFDSIDICPNGWGCCGHQCYNPKEKTCVAKYYGQV